MNAIGIIFVFLHIMIELVPFICRFHHFSITGISMSASTWTLMTMNICTLMCHNNHLTICMYLFRTLLITSSTFHKHALHYCIKLYFFLWKLLNSSIIFSLLFSVLTLEYMQWCFWSIGNLLGLFCATYFSLVIFPT